MNALPRPHFDFGSTRQKGRKPESEQRSANKRRSDVIVDRAAPKRTKVERNGVAVKKPVALASRPDDHNSVGENQDNEFGDFSDDVNSENEGNEVVSKGKKPLTTATKPKTHGARGENILNCPLLPATPPLYEM
jgi:hypothetical protein